MLIGLDAMNLTSDFRDLQALDLEDAGEAVHGTGAVDYEDRGAITSRR